MLSHFPRSVLDFGPRFSSPFILGQPAREFSLNKIQDFCPHVHVQRHSQYHFPWTCGVFCRVPLPPSHIVRNGILMGCLRPSLKGYFHLNTHVQGRRHRHGHVDKKR